MEAINALTALVQEESTSTLSMSQLETKPQMPASQTAQESSAAAAEDENQDDAAKRYIPEHKKADAALTFPEKLMNLMKYADKQKAGSSFCVTWLPDGKSFIIRNPDEFTRQVLPKFFKATKFSSFTRKLYRWGFRQVNRGIGPDDPIIFGNEFFQRDDFDVMAKMRSITAASTRKMEQTTFQIMAQKRALDTMDAERDHKRILLEQLMQQKAAFSNPQSMFNNNASMNLTNALRPNLNNFNMGGMKSFDMLGNGFQQNNNPLMNQFTQSINNMNNNGMNGMQNQNNQFQNHSSTADIVSAAINALRFAP